MGDYDVPNFHGAATWRQRLTHLSAGSAATTCGGSSVSTGPTCGIASIAVSALVKGYVFIYPHPDERRCAWCQELLYVMTKNETPVTLCSVCDIPEGFE